MVPPQESSDAPETVDDDRVDERRHWRNHRRFVASCVVATGLVVAVAFFGRARHDELSLKRPLVASGSERVAVPTLAWSCESGPEMVLTPDEVLMARERQRSDFAIPHAEVLDPGPYAFGTGTLVVDRPWFGSYRYTYVAPDGTRVELEPAEKYPRCARESL